MTHTAIHLFGQGFEAGMVEKQDFFEDMAVAMERWAATVADALTNPRADLRWVESHGTFRRIGEALVAANVKESDVKVLMSECFRGFAVSLLTTLDGGTASAEKGRVHLVDEAGRQLGEGLHDDFVLYLLDTGRME